MTTRALHAHYLALQVGDVLDDLQCKTEAMLRATRPFEVTSALFSRSRFTPALVDRAAREGVILVGVAELVDGCPT